MKQVVVVAVLLGIPVLAAESRVTFSMRTSLNCPVLISDIEMSKDYGFHKITVYNDSRQTVQALNFRVTLIPDSGEEIVEGGGVALELAPGERKTLEAGLGDIQKIQERARASGQVWIRAVVYVETAFFDDGTLWEETRAN